ncbi:transcriptional regulator [Pseudonocardiaceae bacterium YIM PH 21723]|nr:transcriptional regulator [Pseudonocardiaceae bacterium YIM PH 21723]
MAEHPLLTAIQPLLDRVGGTLIAAEEITAADVPLLWEGTALAGVRIVPAPSGIDRLLAEVATELGCPLAELARSDKQRAVRLLEERGAFDYRRAPEAVAEALGVTRFTVYNYLNRNR